MHDRYAGLTLLHSNHKKKTVFLCLVSLGSMVMNVCDDQIHPWDARRKSTLAEQQATCLLLGV
jgi:uncharacterized protein YejL (UPF0352 family)